MRVGIIGPGAIGLFLAYALEKGEVSPTLIYRKRFHTVLVEKGGGPKIKIGLDTYSLSLPISYTSMEDKESYDIIFIATKAYDFKDALDEAKRILKKNGVVISIQNGIGPLELSEEALGRLRSISAIITYGATKLNITTTELRGMGKIYIGQRIEKPNPIVEDIKRVLVDGGLDVELVNDIDSYRWLKVLVNSAIGPITTIFRSENRILLENIYIKNLALSVVDEGVKVVKRLGVSLYKNPYDEMFKIVRETAGNKSSMYQDLLAGKRTEIDYINGAIVKYGKEMGVPTPINETLIYLIKGLTIR
jgi:2-dehydropantoate 2-reductase